MVLGHVDDLPSTHEEDTWTTIMVDEPLGDATHHWEWKEDEKKYVCSRSVVNVVPPARLDSLVAPSWAFCRFRHADVDTCDGTAVCESAQLVYNWQTSSLRLTAYFKKLNRHNKHVTS